MGITVQEVKCVDIQVGLDQLDHEHFYETSLGQPFFLVKHIQGESYSSWLFMLEDFTIVPLSEFQPGTKFVQKGTVKEYVLRNG
jgi:hypothetical protein